MSLDCKIRVVDVSYIGDAKRYFGINVQDSEADFTVDGLPGSLFVEFDKDGNLVPKSPEQVFRALYRLNLNGRLPSQAWDIIQFAIDSDKYIEICGSAVEALTLQKIIFCMEDTDDSRYGEPYSVVGVFDESTDTFIEWVIADSVDDAVKRAVLKIYREYKWDLSNKDRVSVHSVFKGWVTEEGDWEGVANLDYIFGETADDV
jgi:hypothetical protein